MNRIKKRIVLVTLLLLTVALFLAWQFAPYQLVIENATGQPIKNLKITGFWQLSGEKQDNEPAPIKVAEVGAGEAAVFWVTGTSGWVTFEATTGTGANVRHSEQNRTRAAPKKVVFDQDGVRIESRHSRPSDLFLR